MYTEGHDLLSIFVVHCIPNCNMYKTYIQAITERAWPFVLINYVHLSKEI